MRETLVQPLGWEDPLEKGMATHSSILAWRVPWTEEPGGPHSPRGHKEPNTAEQLTFSLLPHELLPSPQQAQPSLTSGSHPTLHSFSHPPFPASCSRRVDPAEMTVETLP